jgi:transcriptional regulator with XRE-family HTH domain
MAYFARPAADCTQHFVIASDNILLYPLGMKLADYLADKSRSEFARQLGVTPEAVRLWQIGERTPRRDVMARIAEITGGSVTPADFYASPEAAA